MLKEEKIKIFFLFDDVECVLTVFHIFSKMYGIMPIAFPQVSRHKKMELSVIKYTKPTDCII